MDEKDQGHHDHNGMMHGLGKIVVSSKRQAKSQIAIVDRLLKKAQPPRGVDALEIGCGAGFVSAHLAGTYGMNVRATDADQQMLDVARKKNGVEGVSYSIADAGDLPFGDATFDLVIAQNMLHHVPDWRKAVDEVVRVLRGGGLFLFSDFSGPSTTMKLFTRAKESHGFQDVPELVDRMAIKDTEVIHGNRPDVGREIEMLFRKKSVA
jgi:ubiquinone/menaquinone biosynthesis C-methylase UbiE